MPPKRPILCRSLYRSCLCAAALVAATIAAHRPAEAQIAAMAIEDPFEASHSPTQGFAVLKADNKTIEMIEDFDRYAGKKSWELAFHTLDAIDEGHSRGMVPAGNGFLVPIQVRVQQSLLRLPPQGAKPIACSTMPTPSSFGIICKIAGRALRPTNCRRSASSSIVIF